MKVLRLFSRVLIGMVFSFSGFVKAVDPLGSVYKFNDYFEAFHIGFLSSMSLPLALLLSTAELLIGLNLITGLRIKLTSWALLIFMVFFTILTLIIALENPVTDCGCFGDALILTNWQTFWKNIIFLVPTVFIFFQRNNYQGIFHAKLEWGIVVAYSLAGIFLSVHCLNHLPVNDFRPYKTGTSIVEGKSYPEGAPEAEYDIKLIYEKNGIQKSFKVTDAPAKDSTWKYIDMEKKQIAEGYDPPIHDFSLLDNEGNDITEEVLQDEEYSFLLISYKMEKANKKGLLKANELAKAGKDKFRFYCLTASTNEHIDKISKELGLDFNIYMSDEIMLKTVVRSNPGLVLLKNGSVIRKWHHRDFPQPDEMNEFSLIQLREKYRKQFNRSISLNFILAFIIVAIFFYFGYYKWLSKNKDK